jgi:hypothetical protein
MQICQVIGPSAAFPDGTAACFNGSITIHYTMTSDGFSNWYGIFLGLPTDYRAPTTQGLLTSLSPLQVILIFLSIAIFLYVSYRYRVALYETYQKLKVFWYRVFPSW